MVSTLPRRDHSAVEITAQDDKKQHGIARTPTRSELDRQELSVRRAADKCGLSHTAPTIGALYRVKRAHPEGLIYPSQKRLAEIAGVSPRTVRRHSKRLEEEQLLVVHRHPAKRARDGRFTRRTNRYLICNLKADRIRRVARQARPPEKVSGLDAQRKRHHLTAEGAIVDGNGHVSDLQCRSDLEDTLDLTTVNKGPVVARPLDFEPPGADPRHEVAQIRARLRGLRPYGA